MAKLPINRFSSLDEARAHYLDQVDRLAISVPGTVSATWQIKWQEAVDGGGPMLEAEAEVLGIALAEVVERVTAARLAWSQTEAAREAARVKAKAVIRQSAAPGEMHGALTAYQSALDRVTSMTDRVTRSP